MDAVILFSHGSVLCGSGAALNTHAERLQQRGIAPLVTVGYLNYSEPLFAEAVEYCVSQGATRILVAPYFLVPGYFVNTALPASVASVQASFPGIEFQIAAPIGYDDLLADALIASANNAYPASRWRDDLQRAPEQCRANPRCPLFDTPSCPQHPGTKVLSTRSPAPPPTSSPHHPTPSLLILVHGSPDPSANAEMFRVVEVIRQREIFPIIGVGFLDCNEPDIPTAIDLCAEQGATRILAVPYFLHTGKHVADDLPTLLEEGQQRHPHIEFRLGDYLGRSEHLTDILAARISDLALHLK